MHRAPNISLVKLQIRKIREQFALELDPTGILLYYACIQRADNFILLGTRESRTGMGWNKYCRIDGSLNVLLFAARSWVTFDERRLACLARATFDRETS